MSAKLLAVVAAVLTVSSLACLVLVIPVYRQELLAERQNVSSKLGVMLQITLENAMLKRDIDGLREIVERLGRSKNVSAVMITSPQGEVRFSSVQSRLGHTYKGLAELCPACGLKGDKEETGAAFLQDPDAGEILRSVNVVANREPCTLCHGPIAEHPVNGFLVVDYTAGDVKRQAAWTAALLGLIGFAVVLGAVVAIWLAMRRLVLTPVRRIASASRALAAGDLSARANLRAEGGRRQDEMGDLGHQFDAMASRLQTTVANLREQEQFLQALIDAVPDGIRVIREDFTVAVANRAFCAQVGLPHAAVVGRPCFTSSHGRTEPCIPTMVICPLKALSETEVSVKCRHVHLDHATGIGAAVEVIAAPLEIQTLTGRHRYVVESIRDLTRQVEVSHEQRLSEIGLLAAGVAHEIHNPLSSIRLGLRAIHRTLEGDADDRGALQYLDMINLEIDRCLDVTERLMWISQPPGRHGDLVEIAKVAGDIVALLRYEAGEREIDVVVDVPEGLRIVANGREVGMVLLNLVQNAFHACAAGGRVVVSARQNGAGQVNIAVRDNGAGIHAEDLPKIFHPFWSKRADGSAGTGLGLSICKSIVEKWDGRILVTSEWGQGTTFDLVFRHADAAIEDRQS